MKTVLDEGHTWFFEGIVYQGSTLLIVVVEGFRARTPEDIDIAGTIIRDTYAIDTMPDSRRIEIRFGRTVAWQCVDESWTTYDTDEVRDDGGALQVLTRSKYLDYVTLAHGWYEEVVGPANHYRIWTEDEVIDVVAFDPPSLELTPAPHTP